MTRNLNTAIRRTFVRKLHRFHNSIGHPSMHTFLQVIDSDAFINCPVTLEDNITAEDISRPDLGSLKWKTTGSRPISVNHVVTAVPDSILKQCSSVSLVADIMIVEDEATLIIISQQLRFGTAQHLKNSTAATITEGLRRTINLYKSRGFQVIECRDDGEFEKVSNGLKKLGVTFHTAALDEHVPNVERYIRTIKEKARSTYHTLPYKRFPTLMTIELIMGMVFWLNSVPPSDGVLPILSPRTTGLKVDCRKHGCLGFGSYIQTHEQTDNSMEARSTEALALLPTGNAQGGYYFMRLTTGRKIARY